MSCKYVITFCAQNILKTFLHQPSDDGSRQKGLLWEHKQSLELLMKKKKKENFYWSPGASPLPPPSPRKILKVKTKIYAIWGILEANLKKI